MLFVPCITLLQIATYGEKPLGGLGLLFIIVYNHVSNKHIIYWQVYRTSSRFGGLRASCLEERFDLRSTTLARLSTLSPSDCTPWSEGSEEIWRCDARQWWANTETQKLRSPELFGRVRRRTMQQYWRRSVALGQDLHDKWIIYSLPHSSLMLPIT